jgi:hypothetical protein
MADLEQVAAELAAAERYRTVVLLACAEYVEGLADVDEQARRLRFPLADADRRSEVARFHAQFALPSSPC